ncbi:MAG: hypothetical protein CMN94_10025 [Synechococcus sp. EAC657]|nr:hypothetical protein [Synechococcus sp. EAC657]
MSRPLFKRCVAHALFGSVTGGQPGSGAEEVGWPDHTQCIACSMIWLEAIAALGVALFSRNIPNGSSPNLWTGVSD